MKAALKIWLLRVVMLLAGLTVAHLGVTLFLQAGLGSDPFNVLIQGLFRAIPWPAALPVTHGTVHIAVSFLIIIVLLIVDRSYIKIGTLICMAAGGPIIDMFTLVIGDIINAGSAMPLRIVSLVLGCVILAFGMTIVIKSDCGTGSNDLVAVVISDKLRRKFGIVRIIVDISFALTGFVLGGTLGLGTIVCAFLVGPTAQVFFPISERICARVIGGGTGAGA